MSVESEVRELCSWANVCSDFSAARAGDVDRYEAFENVMGRDFARRLERPLHHEPRNAQHKQEIEQMDRNQVDVVNVLRLADELELDELVALELWKCAVSLTKKDKRQRTDSDADQALEELLGISFVGMDAHEAALRLFFWKRKAVLDILRRVVFLFNPLQGCPDAENKMDVVRRVVSTMLERNLINNLLTTIQTLNIQIEKLLSPQNHNFTCLSLQLESLRAERRLVAESVFLLLHGTFSEDNETTELLRLLKKMSNRFIESRDVASNAREQTSSYETLYVLLMALACTLDRQFELYDRRTKREGPRPVGPGERDWLERFDKELDLESSSTSVAISGGGADVNGNNGNVFNFSDTNTGPGPSMGGNGNGGWLHEGVLGACQLLWGAFLSELDSKNFPNHWLGDSRGWKAKLALGFERRGLAFLRGIVRSPEFVRDEFRVLYLTMLHAFASKVVKVSVDASSSRNDYSEDSPQRDILPSRLNLMLMSKPAEGAYAHHHLHSFGGGHPGKLVAPGLATRPGDRVPDEHALPDTLEDLLALLHAIHILDPSLTERLCGGGGGGGGNSQGNHGGEIWPTFVDEVARVAGASCDDDPYSLYVCFLGFLGSLGGSNDGAQWLAQFLVTPDASGSTLSWGYFLSALQHFAKQTDAGQTNKADAPMEFSQLGFGGQQMLSNPAQIRPQLVKLPDADQIILCSWLRALNSALGNSETAMVFFSDGQTQPAAMGMQGNNTGMMGVGMSMSVSPGSSSSSCGEYIKLCLNLLQFDVEPALKAQLMWSIAKLAPVPGALDALYMHAGDGSAENGSSAFGGFGAMPYTPFGGFGGAQQQQQIQAQQPALTVFERRQQGLERVQELVRRDLDTKEAAMHEYPFTTSFLDLVLAVVQVTPEEHSHVYVRTLTFVLEEVFLKLDQRKYRNPGEQWRLAAACLRIFNFVLERYDKASVSAEIDFEEPDNRFSAGFWLMTKVLEGAHFYRQLILMISLAGGEKGVREAREAAQVEADKNPSTRGFHPQAFGAYQQQQQQQLQGQQQRETKWFMAASRRSHLDIRNSSAAMGEAQGPTNVGYGMVRTRARTQAPTDPTFDGGHFSSWLAKPFVYGWSKTIQMPAHWSAQARKEQRVGDDAGPPNFFTGGPKAGLGSYQWDDGDIGGLWKELAIKLVLRFLEGCSAREAWFFQKLNSSDLALDNRLEHLHRLFAHHCNRLFSVAEFFDYPYSADMQLNAIKLIFRLCHQAPSGSIVQALHPLSAAMRTSLADCLSAAQNGPSAAGMKDGNNSTESFDPALDSLGYEMRASETMAKAVLSLLVEGLSQPRGNLSELLLGFAGIAAGTATVASVNLRPGRRCALSIILGVLDSPEHPWQEDSELVELMYRLVFRLCDNRFTGFAMSYGLNTQLNCFWIRHFSQVASQSDSAVFRSDAMLTQSVAWIIRGAAVDMRVALSGSPRLASCQKLFAALYSVDSVRDVDRTHLRILEVLDAVSFDDEMALVEQPPQVYRDLERFNQQKSKRALSSLLAEYDGHMFFELDLENIRYVYQWWKDEQTQITQQQQQQQQQQRPPQVMSVDVVLREDEQNGEIQLEGWVHQWNAHQRQLAARAHVITAWKELVKFSIVDCRKELVQYCCQGQSDADLLQQLCNSILRKLTKNSDAPPALSAPLADLVVTLVAQLRFAGDEPTDKAGSREAIEAVAAAIGNYSMSFCASGLNTHGFIARVPTEEYKAMLEGILDALHCKNPALRPSLNAALLLLIQGSRELYAQALSAEVCQLPGWLSEHAFLAATEGHSNNDQAVRDLRGRAALTLRSLYSSSLIDTIVSDALESNNRAVRLTSLALLQALVQCDLNDKWFEALQRRGVFRYMISLVVDRVRSDKLYSKESDVDIIYQLSVLSVVAKKSKGALALVESGFLNRLADAPLILLCDKRALDAWSSSMDTGDKGAQNQEQSQERRHDIVLPFLRLILDIFTTLKHEARVGQRSSNENRNRLNSLANDTASFQQDCARFLRTNRRMLSSALGFPATSLQDMEESILLLAILTNCASNGTSFVDTLGASVAADQDQLVFDLVQTLCSPHQSAEWKDTIMPITAPEKARSKMKAQGPADMLCRGRQAQFSALDQSRCSLFQLDIFSQQRRMLQHCVAYLRARKAGFAQVNDSVKENETAQYDETSINALVLCLNYCSESLAAVARSHPSNFRSALTNKTKMSQPASSIHEGQPALVASTDTKWSDTRTYINWTCSSLLFILEGAITVLYYKFKALRLSQRSGAKMKAAYESASRGGESDIVLKWLRTKILVNHFDSTKEKSPIEQLEDVIRTLNDRSSQFVHLVLRRLRELK